VTEGTPSAPTNSAQLFSPVWNDRLAVRALQFHVPFRVTGEGGFRGLACPRAPRSLWTSLVPYLVFRLRVVPILFLQGMETSTRSISSLPRARRTLFPRMSCARSAPLASLYHTTSSRKFFLGSASPFSRLADRALLVPLRGPSALCDDLVFDLFQRAPISIVFFFLSHSAPSLAFGRPFFWSHEGLVALALCCRSNLLRKSRLIRVLRYVSLLSGKPPSPATIGLVAFSLVPSAAPVSHD